jgi:hypothetical protein
LENRIVSTYRPRFPQETIHPKLESHRFCVLVAHRRLGKTVMAVNHLIFRTLENTLPHGRYAYIAPFLKQAKMIAWDYLKRYSGNIPGVVVHEGELYIEINGSKIFLFGADNPDALRGTYLDGVVLDEFAQIKPEVFSEIIRPALSDRNGWALFLGTPKGQNQFYDVYNEAVKRMAKGDPSWWAGLYRADETGVINKEELDQMKSILSDSAYRQEFLCDFSAASDNVLIPIDLVSRAAGHSYKDGEVDNAPRILGVDPARFGDDRSVIIRRQGLQAFNPKVYTKIDNMSLVGMVTQEIEDFKPDAVFIDAGRGEGVIDRLRQLGHKVIEINFGGTPNQPITYSNRRVEMWDLMKEWMEQGGAIPNMPDLKADLVVPTYDFDASNRMRLESKEKIKERLGKSPDIADALALTFAMPVRPKGRFDGLGVKQLDMANTAYDPLK